VGILLVHGSALVEVAAAALITLLTAQPLGRLTLHSCGVTRFYTFCGVADPNPDPPDPHVFGPPGSGSGSFYHYANIVRKTLISTVFLLLFDFSFFEK
jgi:hypothetical protein